MRFPSRLLAHAVWLAGLASMAFLVVIFTPIAWYLAAPLRVPTVPRPSDAIALFSSGQLGTIWVTPDAAQRTLGALDLYRRQFAPVIVTSGSTQTAGSFQAELHAFWLRRMGVPPDRIVVESRSSRTYESVVELQRLMVQRGWRNVVIVTSELDVPRIRLICAKLGVDASYLAVPLVRPPDGSVLYVHNGFPVLYHAIYEYTALLLYRFNGWI